MTAHPWETYYAWNRLFIASRITRFTLVSQKQTNESKYIPVSESIPTLFVWRFKGKVYILPINILSPSLI